MKKIISLLVAVMTMATTITAFAEIQTPENCAPKAVTKFEQVYDADIEYYYCTLTVSLKDLGDLNATFAKPKKHGGLKSSYMSFYIRGAKDMDIMKDEITGNLGDVASRGSTMDYTGADASGINFTYSTTDGSVAYPVADATNTSVTATECEDAVVLNFYSLPGTFTISQATIGFVPFENNAIKAGYETSYADLTFDKTSFTVGEEPQELALTVTPEARQTNGYVWTADITKGANDITSFTAKFTADGETADRAISNIDAVNKFLGEGSTQFNIGLKTAKALTAVEFAVSDGATTATANPAVSQ
jgi:hypothetical protein